MTENYKTFQLFCEHCNWKKITNDGNDLKQLHEIKRSPIQVKIPTYDVVNQKTVDSKFREQKRKFRCPNCGYSMSLKIIVDTQKALESKQEIAERARERKELEEKILEDQRKMYEEKNRFDGS
ncbi:MAG: hypothetical protein DWQ19_11610 [Crenarchaeota archaeon]|nr:MAG: hypothetical protein DWQ19_11610 [Thermoproteota archaeon]